MVVSAAVGLGRRFTYGVSSNLKADQSSEAQKARHREVKRRLYCDDPDMNFFRDRAVTVIFAVIDDTGAPIDNAVTAPGDCM